MKRFITILLLTACVHLLSGQTQKIVYSFEKPEIIKKANNYSEIIIKNCYNFGEEGNPAIPYYASSILLKQGSEIESVTITDITYYNDIQDIPIYRVSTSIYVIQPFR